MRYFLLVLSLFLLFSWPVFASSPSIIRDAEIEQFISEIAEPIFQKAGLDKSQIKIFIVDDAAINAFVSGGQNLFINTGLIRKFKTPDALVGVIAHETGHIAAGHLVRSYEKGSALQGQMALAYALGIAAIAAGSPQAGTAMIMGSSQIAQRSFLKFTRSQEEAADSLAISYLNQIHYPAEGLINLLEIFDHDLIGLRDRIDEYQITHPVSRKRIDLIKAKTAGKNFTKNSDYKARNQALQKKMNWVLLKLEGFLDDPSQILEKYQDDSDQDALYVKAIANFRLANFSISQRMMNLLIKNHPDNGFLFELSGDFFNGEGKSKEAIFAYKQAIRLLSPKAAVISRINLANNLISNIESDKDLLNYAIKELNQVKNFEDENPALFKLLAQAYQKISNEGRYFLSLAEYNYLLQDFKKCKNFAKNAQENLAKEDKAANLRSKDLIEVCKE